MDLRELGDPSGLKLVFFLGAGRSGLGYDEFTVGCERLERGGNEVKRPIPYHRPPITQWTFL